MTRLKAQDVANYFLALEDEDCGDTISNLKLQKLLYYAQGYYLAISGQPLFNESIEAWQHGPVVPSIYHAYKECGSGALPRPDDIDFKLYSDDIRKLLDETYNVFGQFSAWKLRDMTHEEPPWRDTPPQFRYLARKHATIFRHAVGKLIMGHNGKLKRPEINKGVHERPRPTLSPSPQTEYIVFNLSCDDDEFCLTHCTPDQKAAFAEKIHTLSKMTWGEIRSAHRHGLGCEKIDINNLKRPLPNGVSQDTTILAFRCFGKAPMVGYRKENAFRILWFDPKFTLYDHE